METNENIITRKVEKRFELFLTILFEMSFYQLAEERLRKIRSDIIQKKNDKERKKRENTVQRSIVPCFCTENAKHPKWSLCPIDMSPKLYFVNHTNTKNSDKFEKTRVIMTKKSNTAKGKFSSLPNTSFLNSSQLDNFSTLNQRNNDCCSGDTVKEKMTLRFRIDSANTDRSKTLNNGFFKKGFYTAPRPHHFRDDIHRSVSLFFCSLFFTIHFTSLHNSSGQP